MSNSGPKPDQNTVRFPNNPMSPRYSPRRTRFGGESQDSATRKPPNFESLSPKSRTREIARGRMEMMEMVRNMPESCYELSLKDLVEKTTLTDQETGDSDEKAPENGEKTSSKRQNSVRKKNYDPIRTGNTGSIGNGGFLLKMVFPVSSSPKQKKVNRHGNSSPARVSPRPSVDGSAKGSGMDWWKKKGSENGEKNADFDKSIGISRSSSRRRRGRRSGCWPLMRIKRSKSPE